LKRQAEEKEKKVRAKALIKQEEKDKKNIRKK
jgi:hypothetical protein